MGRDILITLTATNYVAEDDIIEIDSRNILSMEFSIFDRSGLKLPSFGIISNNGRIEFTDYDGRIFRYAQNLMIIRGLKCEMYLTNTLVAGATTKIASMETDQWDYDNDNRVVSVSLKDDLEEWQEINVDEISYDISNPEKKPFSWLYEYLYEYTKQSYNMQSIDELDDETKAVLQNTYIKYPLLKSGNLWQQWNKLCQACQLHIYKNNQGIIVCKYNGGN
jgi:hypothetical protein